jgi:apolipoprotein N-acyltransferase
LNPFIRRLPAILSGVLIALSSPPFDQWYLAYIAFIPLFLQTRNSSPVERGMAYALCCSVIATNWYHSTIIFSVLFFLLIVGILCSAFFIWGFLSATFKPSKTNPFIALLAPGVIWIGIERVLTSEWVGIPCNFGITQSSQPLLIQSASLFGIYASSFLIVLSNTALAMLIGHWMSRQTISTLHWMAFFTAVTLMGLNIGYGFSKTYLPIEAEDPVKVAVVQPMISSDLFRNGWRNPENRDFMKNTLDQLTAQAVATQPDILFWPEGGNGYLNMRIPELRDSLYNTATRFNTDLLISSNDLDEQGKKYNSIFSISNKGKLLGRYDKVMLIPIAEDSYTAGDEYHSIPSSFGEVGPVICYESNFPSPFRKVSARGAELLFVSTSDAVFKKTSLTINHTRMAIFRAVENNRWVIHASNTGPSVIVAPTGQVTASTPFYNRGFVTGSVAFIQELSFFTRFGYLVPVLFALLAAVLLATQLYQGVILLSGPARRVGATKALALMQPNDIERRLKAWLGIVGKRLPITLLYGLFLVSIMTSSILLVNQQTTPENSVYYALKDLISPIDTLETDKVTQKFLQAKSNSCGPAALAYIFSYFGKNSLEEELIRQLTMTEEGTSMLELKKVAIRNEFQAIGVKENYQALMEEPLPVIAYINDSHYVVVNKITPYHVWVFDPAIGHVKILRPLFEQAWNGYLLLIRMPPIQKSIMKVTEEIPMQDTDSNRRLVSG